MRSGINSAAFYFKPAIQQLDNASIIYKFAPAKNRICVNSGVAPVSIKRIITRVKTQVKRYAIRKHIGVRKCQFGIAVRHDGLQTDGIVRRN